MEKSPPNHEATVGAGMIPLHVPADLYEEVLHFISDRRREKRAPPALNSPAPATLDRLDVVVPSPEPEPLEWDSSSLLEFLDQANAKLKLALVAVAEADDLTLATAEIADASGVPTGRGWGGFLSRAQASCRHRFGRNLPLKWKGRDQETGSNVYFLDERDAAVILIWATQQSSSLRR